MSKRIKTRDKANDLKNEAIDKKEGQIYFDGMVYTARWSALPSYLGESPFNIFKERENPEDIYVMIRNRLKNNLLTEFYLEDAIKLAKRFYDALPDTLATVKRFVEVTRLELQTHVNDEHFTRKRGLYKFSMLLNRTHQHEFESGNFSRFTTKNHKFLFQKYKETEIDKLVSLEK